MPGTQRKTPEAPEAPEETPEAPASSEETFVVLSSAVVVTVGRVKYGPKRGAPEVRRFYRGQIIRLDPEHADIQRLIDLRAIAVNDGEPKTATTPTLAAQAAGGIDDPAVPADADFKAINAPAEVTADDDLSEGDKTSDAETK